MLWRIVLLLLGRALFTTLLGGELFHHLAWW
jgi:hypothetical protein